MAAHATILALPSSVVALLVSPVNDVTSSPSSAHVRMVLLALKVKGHTIASVRVAILEGTANEMSMTVNPTHVKTVS